MEVHNIHLHVHPVYSITEPKEGSETTPQQNTLPMTQKQTNKKTNNAVYHITEEVKNITGRLLQTNKKFYFDFPLWKK